MKQTELFHSLLHTMAQNHPLYWMVTWPSVIEEKLSVLPLYWTLNKETVMPNKILKWSRTFWYLTTLSVLTTSRVWNFVLEPLTRGFKGFDLVVCFLFEFSAASFLEGDPHGKFFYWNLSRCKLVLAFFWKKKIGRTELDE